MPQARLRVGSGFSNRSNPVPSTPIVPPTSNPCSFTPTIVSSDSSGETCRASYSTRGPKGCSSDPSALTTKYSAGPGSGKRRTRMRPVAPAGPVATTVGVGAASDAVCIGCDVGSGDGDGDTTDDGDAVGTTAPEQADSASVAITVAASCRRIRFTFVTGADGVGAYSPDDLARRRVGVKFAPTHEMSRSSGLVMALRSGSR